jgi:hypothetical protein
VIVFSQRVRNVACATATEQRTAHNNSTPANRQMLWILAALRFSLLKIILVP